MKHIDFSREYQHAFHFKGMSFFIQDVWMTFYREVDAMITAVENETNYWFPKVSMKEMLSEGGRFFADQEAFEAYYTAHMAFLESLASTYESEIRTPAMVNRDGVKKFLELLAETFRHFHKTEYFYVDTAFELSKSNPIIKANLERNYALKERARVEALNNPYYGENSYVNVLFRKLAAQFSVTEKELANYGTKDILNLFSGIQVSSDILLNRGAASIMFGKEGTLHVFFDDDAKGDILELLQKSADMVLPLGDVLKGIPASRGKVRGRVKVIVSDPTTFDALPREFAAMHKGDILVAETTSPEFMPACEKAGAILANQGGMLSHAAVVSREFGIPCIVGLKHATHILRDGDIVEVDADKGIVRVLNRVHV